MINGFVHALFSLSTHCPRRTRDICVCFGTGSEDLGGGNRSWGDRRSSYLEEEPWMGPSGRMGWGTSCPGKGLEAANNCSLRNLQGPTRYLWLDEMLQPHHERPRVPRWGHWDFSGQQGPIEDGVRGKSCVRFGRDHGSSTSGRWGGAARLERWTKDEAARRKGENSKAT